MEPRETYRAQDTRAHCQLMLSFKSTNQHPYVLLLRDALNLFSAQPVFVFGLPQPRCRTLHLPLLNLMRFTQAHLSSLSRSIWMESLPSIASTAPHCLVSSENLLRVHSIPLSKSPTKMLNSTSPSIGSWGTLLVTDLHLDIEPLTVTLWAWPFRQFLTHGVVHTSDLCLSNLEVRRSCGKVSNILHKSQ